MNICTTRTFRRCWFALAFSVLVLSGVVARAADLKLEAQLIWGTNEKKSPDPELKPVGPKLAKILSDLPIKWKYYFTVKKVEFTLAQGETKEVAMSKECEIKVKNIDGDSVQLQLIGRGKPVGKITKKLSKGECLVTGGEAPNYTSWFVVLRQKD